MKIAGLAEVKAHFSTYIQECETKGPVIVTRNGKAVAVLISPADDDDLERLVLSQSPRFRSILEKSRRSIRAGRGLKADQFWQKAAKGKSRRRPKKDS